jgi:hypothetical protein
MHLAPPLTSISTPSTYTPKLALFALALLAATTAANPLERRCGELGAACTSFKDCCPYSICIPGEGTRPGVPPLRSVIAYACRQGACTCGREGWARVRKGMFDAGDARGRPNVRV